jgi:hypothetical protein
MKCRTNSYSLIIDVEKTFPCILVGIELWNVLGDLSMLNRILFQYTVLEITTRLVNHIHLVIRFCK